MVTTSAQAAGWYAHAGITNILHSQWAANPAFFHPIQITQDIAVSFVGQYKPGRAALLRALEHAGIRTEAFGMGWPNGRMPQEKLPELYSRSTINLNFNDRPSRSAMRKHGGILPSRTSMRARSRSSPARDF
jgi:hypothetical protein